LAPARRTQSFAEERRQDSLQVSLPAQELVTTFPDDDVSVETVGQFLVEASPLSVHSCACEGWCHSLLGQLLHIDRVSDDSPYCRSDVARCVLTPSRQLDNPLAVSALSEKARSGGTDVPCRNHGNRLVREKECRKDTLLDSVERPAPVFHEIRRTDERRGGFSATEHSLCVAETQHRAGSIRLLSANGRQQDDMRNAGGLDCRRDGVCAAVVVHAHVARTEVWRKQDVVALRAAEGTLECGPLVDLGN